MSCEHEHIHGGNGGGGGEEEGIHTHPPHEPAHPTSPAQSLLPYVDLPRVAAQNAAPLPRASRGPAALLRSHADRHATAPQLAPLPPLSHGASDLLLALPLTVPCRLFSVILRVVSTGDSGSDGDTGSTGDTHTAIPVHLYRNPRDASIDALAARSQSSPPKGLAGTAVEHPAATDLHCEHHLPRRHFANTTQLVIYFPEFPSGVALVCVELRGEPLITAPNRGLPTSLQVETAPRLEDHPRVGSLLSNNSLNQI